jgi:CRP-like cAMP-binding protein
VYGNARDIEWALADGLVYLLQCRAVTTSTAKAAAIDPTAALPVNDPAEVLPAVPLFAGLTDDEVATIAALCKARRFEAGETVIREGTGGAAFYLIDAGEVRVTIRGEEVAALGPGDHFGEIALIDGGQRLATVTATSELVCHGLTYWEFRPLVQQNGALGWKLLESMAQMLRDAQAAPPS